MTQRVSIRTFLCLLLCLAPALAQDWRPATTRAVVVGVLEWQATSIPQFSKEMRQDVALVEALRARGVPDENIEVLLDREATRESVVEALSRVSAQTEPDETLLFYYAGHGVIRDGKIQFANYDWSPEHALKMDDLTDAMDECRGQVLLTADCCYSGGLMEVASSLEERGLRAACLASASATVPSGSNWTFTMTLLEVLSGQRSADLNNDHKITLAEAGELVAQCMKYYDLQESSYLNAGLDGLVLTPVTTIETRPFLPPPFRPYEWGQTQVDGIWRPGRMVGYFEGSISLLTQAYNERPVLSVSRDDLWNFPPKPDPLPEEANQRKASVGGKYRNLLRTFPREYDYLGFTGFQDLGKREIENYNGFTNLPPGYWVYAYPNWYIWGELADHQQADARAHQSNFR